MEAPTDADQSTEGSDQEPPGPEESGSASQEYLDSLLDMSEESFWMLPAWYEERWSSGWEEAVRGWGRVAPMAGVYPPCRKELDPKKLKKAKQTKTPTQLPPTVGGLLCSDSSGAPPDWSLNSGFFSPPENRAATATVPANAVLAVAPQEVKVRDAPRPPSPTLHVHRPPRKAHAKSSTVVPIKNITFSPPPDPVRLRTQGVVTHRAAEDEATEWEAPCGGRRVAAPPRGRDQRAERPRGEQAHPGPNLSPNPECCWAAGIGAHGGPLAEALRLRRPPSQQASSKSALVSFKKFNGLPPLRPQGLGQPPQAGGGESESEGLCFHACRDWPDAKASPFTSGPRRLTSAYEASLDTDAGQALCGPFFVRAAGEPAPT